MINKVICAAFLTLAPLLSNAQSLIDNKGDTILSAGSSESLERDLLRSGEKSVSRLFKKSIRYIVPASMVAYGFLANENHPLQDFNEKIRAEVLEMPSRRSSFEVEDYLQNVPVYSVFALNAVGVKGQNGTMDRIALYGISNTIMSQTVSKLKTLSRKLRPDGSDHRSFPSGHAANAFATAEFMRLEYRNASPIYGIVAYGIAATTGAFRIYHNNHWFSDVVTGAGIGILSTDLTYFVYPKIKKLASRVVKLKTNNLNISPIYQKGAAGFALVYKPK